ncbi:hypothetical protein LB543_01330 [Mesorhizobium sp. ESP7-2]|uniref:hypothetical protein n=1 Tax=Mesorhizobium sp. ESP7-2 TaxID=2876622 RepID=UPI001CCC73D1|nr:hypothetical protein [Mesorhizobium sp. ESP7-2]MBZ9705370.1 hypothetical protein [Mesorhizobium sp. ESP7-2]
MTKAVSTLPQARNQIETMAVMLGERDQRVTDLKAHIESVDKANMDYRTRLSVQSQELERLRKDIGNAYDARLEAQLGFARAIGYIAALKGEPFNDDPGNKF